MSTRYKIIAYPSAIPNVYTVPVGPNGSWGAGYDNWGDGSLVYVNDDPNQGVDPDNRVYWGWMNGPTPQSEQLPASSVALLEAMAGVTVEVNP